MADTDGHSDGELKLAHAVQQHALKRGYLDEIELFLFGFIHHDKHSTRCVCLATSVGPVVAGVQIGSEMVTNRVVKQTLLGKPVRTFTVSGGQVVGVLEPVWMSLPTSLLATCFYCQD